MNWPAPNVFKSLPEGSNWKIGLMPALAPPHVVPPAPLLPQRSITQIVPSGAVVTLAVEPHFRPAGSSPQSTPARYGFGRSLRAPSSETAGSVTGYWPGKIACWGAPSRGVVGKP